MQSFNEKSYTREQKQAIVEKLREYCKEIISYIKNPDNKPFAHKRQTAIEWIEQAKKELGYE